MKIYEITERTPQLIQRLTEVWESSVRKTHLFLSDAEIMQIKEYVPNAIAEVGHLFIAENKQSCQAAFMGIENGRLEMLFVLPEERGNGIGKALLHKGISEYSVNEVTVNEQNPQAIGFYEHMGFTTYKRTPLDEQGQPYPLLYMKL